MKYTSLYNSAVSFYTLINTQNRFSRLIPRTTSGVCSLRQTPDSLHSHHSVAGVRQMVNNYTPGQVASCKNATTIKQTTTLDKNAVLTLLSTKRLTELQ